MNNVTVRLNGLSIGYQSKGNTRVVLSGLEATVNPGELTCLTGANGVGKSTLLRTLSGFQPALSGSVLLQERPLTSFTDRELSRLIGVVLTERPDVHDMTASELVALGRQPYTGFWGTLTSADRRIVADAMAEVGISELADRLVETLSDGERQKVMIAKSLAQQTPVIYLDEPTAFLDFPSKVDSLLLLHRIAHETGKTIFLSTHDLELALQIADTIWLMDRREGLVTGTPAELAQRGTLAAFVERDGLSFDPHTLTFRVSRSAARRPEVAGKAASGSPLAG